MSTNHRNTNLLRRGLDALLVVLASVMLSSGGGLSFSQDVSSLDSLPGVAAGNPHHCPGAELPAVDVLESGEDNEDASHKDARRLLATIRFDSPLGPTYVRDTRRLRASALESRLTTGSRLARGPPALS